jgi:ParB family chromosome partitioning protein
VPKRGLPDTVRMRHDEHYVETLTSYAAAPVGRLVPIEQVDPNPNQPRQVMGDLSELMASISEKGILEPLLVRQQGERYQIVAGERRYQAAVQVGLHEIPVVVRDADDQEAIELALVENLQRKDLTAFEEAEGLHALVQRGTYTHEELARRLGKSRTSITETLSLNKMPDEVKNLCRLADISSKSLLLEIVRQPNVAKMIALVERIASRNATTREDVRRQVAKPQRGRPKPFVFSYRPNTKAFALSLKFRKGHVEEDEIINALEAILEDLRSARLQKAGA